MIRCKTSETPPFPAISHPASAGLIGTSFLWDISLWHDYTSWGHPCCAGVILPRVRWGKGMLSVLPQRMLHRISAGSNGWLRSFGPGRYTSGPSQPDPLLPKFLLHLVACNCSCRFSAAMLWRHGFCTKHAPTKGPRMLPQPLLPGLSAGTNGVDYDLRPPR